jgi:hypothetical protein
MTDDHIMIDSTNHCVIGKSNNKENWRNFFDLFPRYQNIFEVVHSTDSTVIMQGYSVCSDERLIKICVIYLRARKLPFKKKSLLLRTDNSK